MSEQERKVKHIAARIISIIALIIGIATLLGILLIVPAVLWLAIYPDNDTEVGVIGLIFIVMAILSIYNMWTYRLLIGIGLVLSIVTLFIERNNYYRLLPLAFVLADILLFVVLLYVVTLP